MSKKKGFLRGIGHVFEKLGRGCRKMVNGALNGVDKVVSTTNEAVKDSGIADALANTKIGFSAGLGENTGPQVYCQPANNRNTIGYGINTSSKSISFFVNNQAVELTKKQSVEQLIAQRDELLQEAHGPGYIPESSLATMAGTAVASAAKFALDDAIALTNEVTEFHLNSTTAIYSANDTDRAEALNKNINKMQAVGQAISVVLTDPAIIPAHFENRAINASNSFAVAFDSGNLTSAGEAVGQMVYDIQTIAGAAAMAYTATGNVAKATNTFIRANEFRSPIVLQYDTTRLNSGFPVDMVKLQSPVVKKGNPAASNVAQAQEIAGAAAQVTIPEKLTKTQIIEFLQNVDKMPLEQLAANLERMGFELLEYRPDKSIYKFSHVKNNGLRRAGKSKEELGLITGKAKANLKSAKVMVEIHCDATSGPHMHIVDTHGNVYDKNLNNLTAKYRKENPELSEKIIEKRVEKLPEAHIEIKEFVELNMRPTNE